MPTNPAEVTVVLAAIALWFGLAGLVAWVASSFHRPPATWFLLAIVFPPVLVLIVLFFIGDPQENAALKEKEEELRRRHPDRKDLRDAVVNETTCPHCGAAVNPITMDGLYAPQGEPWLLVCNQCHHSFEPDV